MSRLWAALLIVTAIVVPIATSVPACGSWSMTRSTSSGSASW